ncbi:MAG: isoprenylcysteine carboxyl methyltransferase [Nitrospira sp. SG-bin1]|nr:MAG: isoprenylcysteine carboxyl methyltransferase [Nitrospira sp. SG-bin1]
MDNDTVYGVWWLVFVNSLFFIVFAFGFMRPRTGRDWRSLGAFSAFMVALFSEMYGFPLSIYLLSGWLASRYPEVDPFAHDTGHFWHILLGIPGPAHADPLHIFSEILVFVGLILLAVSWRTLYWAQRDQILATTGPYALIRHPQYAAFMLIMLGFLLQWPTIPTLFMFPVLIGMYVLLAHEEEAEARAKFGEVYDRYAARTPAFVPSWRTRGQEADIER